MECYVFKKHLMSRKGLLCLFVLLIMLVIDFPVFDVPEYFPVPIKKAQAVIGRPATPGSAAGVRRRTRRRTVRRVNRHSVAYGSRVYVLPSGCGTVIRSGVQYYYCGGAYYQPYYEGDQVVYVVVAEP